MTLVKMNSCEEFIVSLIQKQWRISPKTKILKWRKFHHSIHYPTQWKNWCLNWVKQLKLHTCITNQKKALERFPQNYRDNLHSASGVLPAAIMLRDDKQTHFPRKPLMHPLGKTMKIALLHHHPEKKTLESFVQNYGDTPHAVTGIFPAAITFRADKQTHFPRNPMTRGVY